MQTRYQNLLDELHTNKRELANYRQKYLTLQSELLALQEQGRNFKKTISSQKQTIQKLTELTKALQSQKQSILSDYSTTVQSIKQEINKKQQQIHTLEENTYSPLVNHKLFEKQLRCQIQSQFQALLQIKDKRIRELTQLLSKANFDKVVDREKHDIKLQSLQKQLKEMQSAHMIQLQNYANRTYQNSQSTKTSQQQSLIKKLRRQIDQLRITLHSTKQQLHESISQKNIIQKQHSAFVHKHNKQVEKYAEQLRVLQFDNERYHSTVIKSKPQKENYLIKDKQKQIKSLKNQTQQLHEKLNKLNSKHSELQVELVNKDNQMKKLKQFTQKHQNQTISELKTQNQSFKRQLHELKTVNENLKKNNLELINSFSDINLKSLNYIHNNLNTNHQSNTQANHKNTSSFSRQSKQNGLSVNDNRLSINDHQNSHTQIAAQKHNKQSKPSIIDEYEQNQEVDNSFNNNLQRAKSSTNLRPQNRSKLQIFRQHYEEQCHRNKELSHKYVGLKKKYKILQEKFSQANNKLMELLKDKIQLNSPTAASQKSFQFPTSPNPKYFLSPEPTPNFHGAQNSHQNIHFSRTQGNLNNQVRNLHFSPQFTIARAKKAERSQSQSKGGDQSFYEKSLKIKTSHKFREIKCLNHDDSQEDHTHCSHSPLK